MITIETITTVKPPIPIKLFIDNLDSDIDNDHLFTATTGFTQDFVLPKGKYVMTVSGMNGKTNATTNGTTTVRISGTFKSAPQPASPQSTSDNFFFLAFEFEI